MGNFILSDKELSKIQQLSDNLTRDQMIVFLYSKGFKFFHGLLKEWLNDLTLKLINEKHTLDEVNGLRYTIQVITDLLENINTLYEEIKDVRAKDEPGDDEGAFIDSNTNTREYGSELKPKEREFPINRRI